MYRRNKIVTCSGRYIKVVFKVEQRVGEMPVRERGMRKKRRANRKILKSGNDQRVG